MTRIEVAVVVVLLLVMAAVFLPGCSDARSNARRIECQHNMKQLVLAALNSSFRKNGELPWLHETYGFGTDKEVRVPWTVSLLPYLEQVTLFDEIQADPYEFQNRSPILLKPFQCPVDDFNSTTPGGLSYVANAGYIRADIFSQKAANWQLAHSLTAIDWDRNGTIDDEDLKTAYATGTFWPRTPEPPEDEKLALLKHSMSLDYISVVDGQSHTILLSENRQARNWHRADALHDFAFGVPVDPAADFVAADQDQQLAFKPSFEKSLHAQNALPDENPKAKPGAAARPSSNHDGFLIVGFVDGSAKPVSSAIDWSVYVRLLTPGGRKFGQTADGLDSY